MAKAADPEFSEFEFRPSSGNFPDRWGGMNQEADPAGMPNNQFYYLENVLLRNDGLIDRGGQSRINSAGALSGTIVGIVDPTIASGGVVSSQNNGTNIYGTSTCSPLEAGTGTLGTRVYMFGRCTCSNYNFGFFHYAPDQNPTVQFVSAYKVPTVGQRIQALCTMGNYIYFTFNYYPYNSVVNPQTRTAYVMVLPKQPLNGSVDPGLLCMFDLGSTATDPVGIGDINTYHSGMVLTTAHLNTISGNPVTAETYLLEPSMRRVFKSDSFSFSTAVAGGYTAGLGAQFREDYIVAMSDPGAASNGVTNTPTIRRYSIQAGTWSTLTNNTGGTVVAWGAWTKPIVYKDVCYLIGAGRLASGNLGPIILKIDSGGTSFSVAHDMTQAFGTYTNAQPNMFGAIGPDKKLWFYTGRIKTATQDERYLHSFDGTTWTDRAKEIYTSATGQTTSANVTSWGMAVTRNKLFVLMGDTTGAPDNSFLIASPAGSVTGTWTLEASTSGTTAVLETYGANQFNVPSTAGITVL